jgi:hypothetical protein
LWLTTDSRHGGATTQTPTAKYQALSSQYSFVSCNFYEKSCKCCTGLDFWNLALSRARGVCYLAARLPERTQLVRRLRLANTRRLWFSRRKQPCSRSARPILHRPRRQSMEGFSDAQGSAYDDRVGSGCHCLAYYRSHAQRRRLRPRGVPPHVRPCADDACEQLRSGLCRAGVPWILSGTRQRATTGSAALPGPAICAPGRTALRRCANSGAVEYAQWPVIQSAPTDFSFSAGATPAASQSPPCPAEHAYSGGTGGRR